MKCLWFLVLFFIVSTISIEHDFKGFDDNILYSINWPGAPELLENAIEEDLNKSQNREILKVQTSSKEKYECHLPVVQNEESKNNVEYNGPSPINLLKPLFSQKICSYRLESYWSYEVCHGRYIRQYHEDREGKNLKTQEYFLGHWSPDKQTKLEADLKTAQDSEIAFKSTKVELQNLTYIEMTMDDGTLCDLNGKQRLTRVQYVCYSHGKHEVYSFKEISTCEYEIIILSPLLCEHPKFKPKEVNENIIDCNPVGDSPKKPKNLLKMEVDSLRFQHQSIRFKSNEKDAKDVIAVLKVEKIEQDGETLLKLELHPLGEEEDAVDSKSPPALDAPVAPIKDDSPVRAFLNGENCLNGGTGWWKYEFCFGKHVVQYHVDRTGEKTTVLLGKFDEQAHLDWIKENKGKTPKPIEHRTSISHFYSNGEVCDKTGKPRQTEVKLKCLENSSSPAQVSLYLLEPRTCHYILGVESPLICSILPIADENGLIKTEIPPAEPYTPLNHVKDEDDNVNSDVVKRGND